MCRMERLNARFVAVISRFQKKNILKKQAEEAERAKLPIKNPTRLGRNSIQIIAV